MVLLVGLLVLLLLAVALPPLRGVAVAVAVAVLAFLGAASLQQLMHLQLCFVWWRAAVVEAGVCGGPSLQQPAHHHSPHTVSPVEVGLPLQLARQLRWQTVPAPLLLQHFLLVLLGSHLGRLRQQRVGGVEVVWVLV